MEPMVGIEPTTDGLRNLISKTQKTRETIVFLERNALFRKCSKRKFSHQNEASVS